MNIDAIVLAAGSSVRFGSDKRLYPVDGVPMLQRAVAVVIESVRSVHVVLKASDQARRQDLLGRYVGDSQVCPLWLPMPEHGMGANLAAAVAALPQDCDAVLVMLADLPWVQPDTVRAVLEAAAPQRIVVPVTAAGTEGLHRGHPVLFPRDCFAALQTLQGDRGARSILMQCAGRVQECVVEDAGILRDLDVAPA